MSRCIEVKVRPFRLSRRIILGGGEQSVLFLGYVGYGAGFESPGIIGSIVDGKIFGSNHPSVGIATGKGSTILCGEIGEQHDVMLESRGQCNLRTQKDGGLLQRWKGLNRAIGWEVPPSAILPMQHEPIEPVEICGIQRLLQTFLEIALEDLLIHRGELKDLAIPLGAIAHMTL